MESNPFLKLVPRTDARGWRRMDVEAFSRRLNSGYNRSGLAGKCLICDLKTTIYPYAMDVLTPRSGTSGLFTAYFIAALLFVCPPVVCLSNPGGRCLRVCLWAAVRWMEVLPLCLTSTFEVWEEAGGSNFKLYCLPVVLLFHHIP